MAKRPKVDEPTALGLLIPARTTRERMHSDGHEFAPMVLAAPRKGKAYAAVMAAEAPLLEQLTAVLAEMRAELGPLLWIAVTTDAFVKETRNPDDIPDGPLAEAFAAGDPTIQEQMVVVLRHRYKPTQTATQTYRFIPSEGWEWDDAETIETQRGGILAVLDHFIV